MLPDYPDRDWNGTNAFYNEFRNIFRKTFPDKPNKASIRAAKDYINHVVNTDPAPTFAREIERFKKYIKYHNN